MVGKKRRVKARTKRVRSNLKSSMSLGKKIDIAWKNFTLFVVLFILSFVLSRVSSNSLLVNFFGILSIILGFLTFAFLIALIALSILKAGRK